MDLHGMKRMNDFGRARKKARKYIYLQFVLFLVLILSVYFEMKLFTISISSLYKAVGWFIFISGSLFFLITVFQFAQFITPNPVPRDKAKLRTSGVYSYIRHPMYFSLILISTGYVILNGCVVSILIVSLISIFFVKKIKLEEQMLISKFPQYIDYVEKTKRLIPFIY